MDALQISLADASQVYELLRTGKQVDWSAIERKAPEAAGSDKLDVTGLKKALSELRKQFPESLPSKSSDGPKFDALACAEIHSRLNISDVLASNQSFWAWLSLKYFWDLINWRHKGTGSFAIVENFSITKRRHGLLERLWFRAELGKLNHGSDPYQIVKTATDRDFWESGIIRPTYSSNRRVASAFIKYQFGVPGGRLHLTDPDGVRMLYKRVKRIYATLSLDVLGESDAEKLISDLAKGLKPSDRSKKQKNKRVA